MHKARHCEARKSNCKSQFVIASAARQSMLAKLWCSWIAALAVTASKCSDAAVAMTNPRFLPQLMELDSPKPFWRQASNTVTATAFDRFRLR